MLGRRPIGTLPSVAAGASSRYNAEMRQPGPVAVEPTDGQRARSVQNEHPYDHRSHEERRSRPRWYRPGRRIKRAEHFHRTSPAPLARAVKGRPVGPSEDRSASAGPERPLTARASAAPTMEIGQPQRLAVPDPDPLSIPTGQCLVQLLVVAQEDVDTKLERQARRSPRRK